MAADRKELPRYKSPDAPLLTGFVPSSVPGTRRTSISRKVGLNIDLCC